MNRLYPFPLNNSCNEYEKSMSMNNNYIMYTMTKLKWMLTLLVLTLCTKISFGQTTPISHLPGVVITASSVYSPMANLNDFRICNYANTGTYGGWMKMDLGATYTIDNIQWWVAMTPSGVVASELVEVSTDNVSWTLAANTSGMHTTFEVKKLNFPTPLLNVRYIRITQSGTPSWFAIGEMIVNEPYFKDNIYENMVPIVLDSTGNEFSGFVPTYPYTLTCSKAFTYQWKKDGVNIVGATSQTYTILSSGNYTCDVTYATAGCGYGVATPPVNAGPKLWLKADAGAYSDAGLTLATNGQAVQQWNDQSGNNNHTTQTTLATRPIYTTNVTNGIPALVFSGAQLMETMSAINWNNTKEVDVFIVCKTSGYNQMLYESSPDVGTNNGSFYHVDNYTPNANGPQLALKGSDGAYRIFNNNASYSPCTKVLQSTYNFGETGSDVIKLKQNNIAIPDIGGYSATTLNEHLNNHVLYIGATNNTVYGINGNISELIAFDRKLSASEAQSVYDYLNEKYFSASAVVQFTALPTMKTSSNSILDDATWRHSYNTSDNSKAIASIKDNCLDLGTRTDTVYVEPTAGLYNGSRYMRRHYTIKTTLNQAGTKQVRLYYTNADFADLQSYLPSLNSHNQLCVSKYDGSNEDGIYNPAGGTVTLIPASQIITGMAFGQHYLEFDVAGFSEFWIHTFDKPLPVNLVSFDVKKCNMNSACLAWNTTQEINFKNYEVQKSTDGIDFKTIATIVAKGEIENNYSYEDKSQTGTIYYRLKMNDIDQKYSLSQVENVNFSTTSDIQIAPNPASTSMLIRGLNSLSTISIVNVQGQVVMKINSSSNPTETIDVSSLKQGFYTIVITNDNAISNYKIIIQR